MLALAAEAAGLDFVTVEPGPLDTLLVAARLAAQTTRIGIVPVVPTTTTEPFHVSTALATIDVISGGRAGWLAEVVAPADARGTVTWAVPDDVDGDAAEHMAVVRALWDSWEDGAEIRDAATARFVDRDRLHHVDFRGTHLSVRGPSITPRPPQGHPVILSRGELAGADAPIGTEIYAERFPGGTGNVLLHAEGLESVLAALPPRATAAGTLRERFGLAPAANRYAA